MSKFTLTPILYNKLVGRGMVMVCSSPHCIYDTHGNHNDPSWDKAIVPKGYGQCPACGAKTEIAFFEHNEQKALQMAHDPKCQYRSKVNLVIPKCSTCGCIMGKEHIIYTQEVVSKHRKSNHYYYHAECYESMFLAETGEGSDKLFKKKKYKMRYAGSHGNGCVVMLPFDPRKGVCSACGKSTHVIGEDGKPEIKTTQIHHWKYAFHPDTVRKNPILILENTSELCFTCHQIADDLRSITKYSAERTVNVIKLIPKDLRERFAIVCSMFLKAMREDG